MAITLVGTEGIFPRWGKIGKEWNRTVSGFGSALSVGTEAIWDEYVSNDQIAIDNLNANRESYRTVHSAYLQNLLNAATNTALEQCNRQATLSSKTLAVALSTLIAEMKSSSDSIARPTVTASATPWASNAGDAVLNASVTNEFGAPLDLVLAETLTFTVTADNANGGTEYSETVTVTGPPAKSVFAWDWPGGSGTSTSVRIFDAAVDDILTNADFADWTATNTPDDWTVVTGTVGTHILRSTSVVRGDYSLQLVADGSTLITLKQAVDLEPNTVYAFNAWMKMSALDSSGVFRIRLTNSSGTTLTDDAGTSLSYTRNTNGNIGTSYTQVQTFFATPRNLPTTTVYLEMGYTTSPASPKTLNIDMVGFDEADQVYRAGPFVKMFSKSNANPRNDYQTLAVANSANTVSFCRMLDRWFNLRGLGLYFPSASSPTIADSLLQ